MLIERLDEAVKVRADFQGGAVQPLVFRRGSVRHRVVSVNARWESREGVEKIYFFSVSVVSGDVYQLRFQASDLRWFADSVAMDA
jgi:hypothetical protein